MRNEELLDDVIEKQIKNLKDTSAGAEERKVTVEELVKLLDRSIEMKKIEIESDDKTADRENEKQLELQKMENEKYDGLIRNGITIGSLLITTGVTVWGVIKSLKFEENGTITTPAGREFFKKAFNMGRK